MDDDAFDAIGETLARPPIPIDDNTTPESIEAELGERLEALLARLQREAGGKEWDAAHPELFEDTDAA